MVEGEGSGAGAGSSHLVSPRRFLEAERALAKARLCVAPTHIRGAASFPWAAAARAGDPAVPTLRGLDAVLPFPAARPGPGVAVAATMAPRLAKVALVGAPGKRCKVVGLGRVERAGEYGQPRGGGAEYLGPSGSSRVE